MNSFATASSAGSTASDLAVIGIPDLMIRSEVGPEVPHRRTCEFIQRVRSMCIGEALAVAETVDDPLRLWALHLRLARLHVPPCLRHDRSETPQHEFVTFLGDVSWIVQNHPDHRPAFARWGGIWKHALHSDQWHRSVLWNYRHAAYKAYAGHYRARGMGLTERQREQLLTMPTKSMQNDRRILRRIAEHEQRLLRHSLSHRDRSDVSTPTAIARRRSLTLRCFLLAGRNQTAATRYIRMLSGRAISRQTLRRELVQIERATDLRLT